MIKVILVDNQLIIREGIKRILEEDKEIKVAGCVENGKAALKLCDQVFTDVIIMDTARLECDELESIRLLKRKCINTKVIMLTSFHVDERISNPFLYGADGYVQKDIRPEALILTVKCVAAGLSVMQRDTYKSIISKLNTNNEISTYRNNAFQIELSDRELSIIRLIVDGKSNSEIAATIHLTKGSVRNVISGVLKKLNLSDRTQLAILAVKNNIV